MATPFQFREATKAADAILTKDKFGRTKAQWAKLPIDTLPSDLEALAREACEAECLARRAMIAFKSVMDDKVIPPSGRKFIYTIERGVTDPNMLGDMLFAEVAASSPGAAVVTFDQLTAKYR